MCKYFTFFWSYECADTQAASRVIVRVQGQLAGEPVLAMLLRGIYIRRDGKVYLVGRWLYTPDDLLYRISSQKSSLGPESFAFLASAKAFVSAL